MNQFNSPVVVIRPALPRDKADVFEFTKFIWDGNDYLKYVFSDWLNDPEGQLFAAEYAGHCVGTGKVTRIAPGQWWLEGFRVDPNYQGMKIGSMIDARCNTWWDEHGDGVLRLMTSSKRVKVHHLSEGRGFRKVGEVVGYEVEPLTESTDAFTPLMPAEADEAVATFSRLAPNRFINLGWRFTTPNVESLRSIAQNGLAWWWRGRRGLVTAWDNEDENDRINLIIGLEACADEDAVELLTDFRRLAFMRNVSAAEWMNVVDEKVIQSLEAAGYVQAWEDPGFLYERIHP